MGRQTFAVFGAGAVGGYFGGRDHSTVLHACKTISQQRQEDSQLRHMLDQLTTGLQRSGK